jgi:hypothetical protein
MFKQVLGQNKKWNSGNMLRFPGSGGQKVNLLRKAISHLDSKMDESKLIMFVDR